MKIARKTFRVEVPVVAMGDIAFNLLIFFVILARAQDDSHLKWQPATTPRVDPARYARATIVVDVNNRLYLNGQETGIADLASRVSQLLGDAAPGDRTVMLKIHRETTAQRFEPIIEAVSQAGGELVHILQEERKP
ncbi:MAG: biopolymer transporter ExbD [Pirellulales bacterium]|nr:biopolymer transporter ExbD [Pirellulales bacterium]